MVKHLFLFLALLSCATTEKKDLAVVDEVLSCDQDEEYETQWCVVVLDDGRWAGVPSWDIREGDQVVCEMRGELTCVKRQSDETL